MRRLPILVLLQLALPALRAQDGVASGTTLQVDPGTTLRFEGAQTVNVQPGATVVNDGAIVFGVNALLVEAPGAPIAGAGVETTTRSYAAPLSATDPAGLGLEITTAIAPGTLTLTRGHLPFTDNGGLQSVARWYDVDADVNTGLDPTIGFHYDLTQLNGVDEIDQVLHVQGPANYWTSFPSTVNTVARTVNAPVIDSLGTYAVFDGISTGIADVLVVSIKCIDHGDGTYLISRSDGQALGEFVVRDVLGREIMRGVATNPSCAIDLRGMSVGVYSVVGAGWEQKLVRR